MALTLAAVGSVVAAILELSLWPYVSVGGGHPHLVLVYVVILSVALGLDAGLTAAFVGGLAIDLLAPRPIGSTAFVLLLSAGLAVALARVLAPIRYVSPIPIAFVLSLFYSVTLAVLYRALGGPVDLTDPLSTLLPGAIYDTILAGLIGPLAVALRVRRLEAERVDW